MSSFPDSFKQCFTFDQFAAITQFRYSLIAQVLLGGDRCYSALVLIRLHQYFYARQSHYSSPETSGPFKTLWRKYYALLCRFVAGYNFTWNAGVQVSPLADISPGLYLHQCQDVTIGSGAKIGRNVHLSKNILLAEKDGQYPVIGDNCILYANAVIIGGVHIGKNCVIAPNAVVAHDMPEGMVVAGNPARALAKNTFHYKPGSPEKIYFESANAPAQTAKSSQASLNL